MSLLTTTAAIAAATLASAYALGGFMSKSIETEIEIDAPVSVVWETFSETASYPEWNPFVRRLDGDWEVGATLDVLVQAEGSSPMTFAPTVLVAENNRELRWVGKLGFRGLFDGEHYYIFEETDRGTTIFRHGETFTGMLTYALLPVIGADTERGFNEMNRALRDRVGASL